VRGDGVSDEDLVELRRRSAFNALRYCEICEERRAEWVDGAGGKGFTVICSACRDGEPCGECGVEKTDCACPGGPVVRRWERIVGAG
jgi:hypothetical protein